LSKEEKDSEEVIDLPPTEEVTSTTSELEETVEVAVDNEVTVEPGVPPFKVMPGSKKAEGLTVRERVPKFTDRVFKLYRKMKRGQRLTEKEFAERLKLKDPRDIQAAGIAWHLMRDEGRIAGEQFYKPLAEE